MNLRQEQMGRKGIVAIMLISSLTVMVGNAITPALPELGRVYELGNYASWLVTAPALGVVATTVLFGRLIDKKGPYGVALIGLICYGIFGIAGAYMPNAVALFIDRLFLGAATAAIMNASVAFISTFFQGERQLKVLAMQGMAMEFGGVVFFSISGMLADLSWRFPFYIYGLGFVALLGLILFIPRPGQTKDSADKPQRAVYQERVGVPISLVLLMAFLGMLVFFTAMVVLPFYLQNQLAYSPAFTGYYLAAIDLVAVGAAGLMPKIVRLIKEKGCLSIAFCCYGVAFLLYFFFNNALFLWIAAFFVGIGFGFSTPLFNSLIVNKSTFANKGLNISLCTMAMFAGQFLSALLISVFTAQNLFIVAAVLSLTIMICIFPLTRQYNRKYDRQ